MGRAGAITMTTRELDRLQIIQAVVDGNLKPGRAAERLGLTDRQVRRLVERVRKQGPVGIVSRRCCRPSNNRAPAELTIQALDINRDRYADFGPTLACESARDFFARIVGEEFVLVLPETDADSAYKVAERYRTLIMREQIPHRGSQDGEHLTISLGVGTIIPTHQDEALAFVDAVDRRLYQAKQEGRNRIARDLQ